MALEDQSARSRREDVLRAAATVFSQKGYRASTIMDIGREVGTTSAALYYYFSSKQDILSELIVRPIVLLHDMAVDVARRDQSCRQKIHDIIRGHIRMMLSQRELFNIFLRERVELDPVPAARLAELEEKYYLVIRAVIAEAAERGEIRDVNIQMASLAIIGMTNWVLRWYRPDGPLTPDEIANSFMDTLSHGIFVPAGGESAVEEVVRAPRGARERKRQ